ncbi:4'-phosphopantetheinyl transferase superfamily protein [Streptomyces sp. NPDC059070]|uniref:4'-phosphopantetheinyl transferase superfamily protein n=1 Tax=Streptomyces sp. NPDC059070 TaxID=3346713 RepID=UPI00369B86D6
MPDPVPPPGHDRAPDRTPARPGPRPEAAEGRTAAEEALRLLAAALRAQGLALGTARADEPGAPAPGPVERALTGAMTPRRSREFLAGRHAARRALAAAGGPVEEIARAGRRPLFPAGFTGSISHSGGLAVALAAPAGRFAALGCDLELRGLPLASAHIVLGPDERGCLEGDAATAEHRLLCAFSAKEAAYKAFGALLGEGAPATLLALVARPVPGGFRARPRTAPGPEVEVRVRPAGPGVFSWAAAPRS